MKPFDNNEQKTLMMEFVEVVDDGHKIALLVTENDEYAGSLCVGLETLQRLKDWQDQVRTGEEDLLIIFNGNVLICPNCVRAFNLTSDRIKSKVKASDVLDYEGKFNQELMDKECAHQKHECPYCKAICDGVEFDGFGDGE